MHLLRHKSGDDFELVTFSTGNLPPYAILSHTWTEGQEVTYAEMVAGAGKDKAGYAKIRFCGERASKDGHEYFWVDTCCINKESSAELSESINSMYRWYQQAKICYVYIEDWPSGLAWAELASIIPVEAVESDPFTGPAHSESRSRSSVPLRWFTRGWTLQELIAPQNIEFFDGNWNAKGTKADPSVLENLSRITGIAPRVLSGNSEGSLRGICHGQRMSWAAYRETSRVEDMAYCLLGIFQINMPLLYGEGTNAFFRLQEEILKSSTDLSLLAWTESSEGSQHYRGIFSRHPREFKALGNCRLDRSQFSVKDEIILTNKGVRIETSLFMPVDANGELITIVLYVLSLGCINDREYVTGIWLIDLEGTYVRADPKRIVGISRLLRRGKAHVIYLAREFDVFSDLSYSLNLKLGIPVTFEAHEPYELSAVTAWPEEYYSNRINTFVVGSLATFVGYLLIDIHDVQPTDPGVKKRLIAGFMAVISKGEHSNVLVNVLNQNQAEEFKNYMKWVHEMDSVTARKELAQIMADLRQNSEPYVVVEDHVTISRLRITGRTSSSVSHGVIISIEEMQRTMLRRLAAGA